MFQGLIGFQLCSRHSAVLTSHLNFVDFQVLGTSVRHTRWNQNFICSSRRRCVSSALPLEDITFPCACVLRNMEYAIQAKGLGFYSLPCRRSSIIAFSSDYGCREFCETRPQWKGACRPRRIVAGTNILYQPPEAHEYPHQQQRLAIRTSIIRIDLFKCRKSFGNNFHVFTELGKPECPCTAASYLGHESNLCPFVLGKRYKMLPEKLARKVDRIKWVDMCPFSRSQRRTVV